jgi:peptidyl-prolyl cis-trans isomerase B (cyclophilin B)
MKSLLLSLIAAGIMAVGCSSAPTASSTVASETTTAGSSTSETTSTEKPAETTTESSTKEEPAKEEPQTGAKPAQATSGATSIGVGEKAVIDTNYGEIQFEFLSAKAPNTCANFIKLANKKFYDGTTFHRVIKGFMIQGGDPNTKPGGKGPAGTGGPGYQIKAEFNDTAHEPGIVSMARSASPDSAGSQFFIVHQTASHLDGSYTAFGKVIKGMDVVNKIAEVSVGEQDAPNEPVIMKTIRIVKK